MIFQKRLKSVVYDFMICEQLEKAKNLMMLSHKLDDIWKKVLNMRIWKNYRIIHIYLKNLIIINELLF